MINNFFSLSNSAKVKGWYRGNDTFGTQSLLSSTSVFQTKRDHRYTHQYYPLALRPWLVPKGCLLGQMLLLPRCPTAWWLCAPALKNSCVSSSPKSQLSEGYLLCPQWPVSTRKWPLVLTASRIQGIVNRWLVTTVTFTWHEHLLFFHELGSCKYCLETALTRHE